MDLFNETVLLKNKNTRLNVLIRETSQVYALKVCLTLYMPHSKCIFSAKSNSRRIAIQWSHIKHYLDYQYTKSSFVPLGCIFF